MFSAEYRAQLRAALLDHAVNDKRLGGVAVTGSAAVDLEDRWSDIDLAFGVAEPDQVGAVVADFTVLMYDRHKALHHHDVTAGAWIYRVFFLPGTLQVDLAFVAQTEFRPIGPTFKLVFGNANPEQPFPPPAAKEMIGLAWLHALHARSCILRGRFWQAEYMISGIRNHVMALACIRHGLPWTHGRGMDMLPSSSTARLLGSMVRELSTDELWRALTVAVEGLIAEVHSTDPAFGARLAADITEVSTRPSS